LADDELEKAIRLDPVNNETFLHSVAQCHFDVGDYEEAARVLRQPITVRPQSDISRGLLAAALGHLGEHDEARRQRARARALDPAYSLRQKRAILPYRDSTMMERMAEGLARAGIDPG
jgi:adenylate cyclase